jgi:RHS repeat-associated protein
MPAEAGKPVHKPACPPTGWGVSLLNEVGQLARVVPNAEVAGWKRELHRGQLSRTRAAQMRLWLGEVEIARNKEPERALRQFALAQRLAGRRSPVYGCAAYDRAITLFLQGAYARSAAEFKRLIAPKTVLPGYDIRSGALWYRHAAACAGYHAQRARMGITEPPQLDPLCGVAGLAACLRANGRPYDKQTLLSHCRMTGLGNNMQDLIAGARRLGMSAHAVKADDTGLTLLPKPLIAYVENDHFVVVIRADKEGVSYLCADCGAWPGGRRDLDWKQWHAMDCNLYLAVTRPGSAEDYTMRLVCPEGSSQRLAVVRSRPSLIADRRTTPPLPRAWMMRLMRAHVVLWESHAVLSCGPASGPHPPCSTNSPTDTPGTGGGGSPGGSGGDPVDLATLEENYTPAPDLTVYNPIGPSVVWQRRYGSLRGNYQVPNGQVPYPQYAFGNYWNTSFDMQVVLSSGVAYLYFPDGSFFGFNVPATPTPAAPQVSCPAVNSGTSMLCSWQLNTDGSYSFVFTRTDRSRQIFSSLNGYALTQIVDRNGKFVNLVYSAPGGTGYQLTAITDSNNTPLLTLHYNSRFNLTAVSDRFGRSVYYRVRRFENVNYSPGDSPYSDELTQVSEIVRMGSTIRPIRFTYGYIPNPNNDDDSYRQPELHTITVPSPAGKGTATATINYNGVFVSSLMDSNGNTRTYTVIDANDTQVTVTDAHHHVVTSYTVGFDGQMRTTYQTDGTNNTQIYQAAYHSDNVYQPYQVTDGNSHTTTYTYYPDGQIETVTSPRGVTTTYTRDYSVFPLGELKQIQEGSKSPTTVAYYEPSGLVQSVTMPTPGTSGATGGVTTSFTYDALGNPLTIARPGNDTTATITTTLNYTTDGSYSQPAAVGQPLTITDNLGHTTHFRYDAQGNRTAVIDAIGNRTDFTYNIANQSTRTLAPAVGDITNQIGVTRSQLTYVAASKTYNGTLTLTNTGSSGLQGYLLAAFTNLAPGVTLANSSGTYVNSPTLLSSQVSLASGASTTLNVSFNAPSANAVFYGVQTYLTDATGNPLAQRSVTQNLYLYPGGPLQAVQTYDEAGALFRQVNYGYGKEGELLSRTGSTEPVTYTYDAAYRLSTLADGNGNATKYTYNPAGWLASVTYPMGDGQQYPSYDPMGHVLKRIDGRGIETDYTYNDPESMLTNVQYVNSPAYPNVSQYNVSIGYDGYGRQQDVYDFSGHQHSDYDDNDTETEIDTAYTGANGTSLPTMELSYAFNPDGSRHTMNVATTTTNYTWNYEYDATGRPQSLTNPFNETTTWSYLNNNWLATQQYANGVVAQYAYNRRGYLDDLTNYAPNSSLLSDFGAMVYDAVGNRLTKWASIPGAPSGYSGNTTYSYDFKDQLKEEKSTLLGGYDETFNYDPAGNPLSFKGTSHSFNADNQFTDAGFTYDSEGNPTTYNSTALAFDPEDHMTAFGATLNAGYRADGVRAWKQTANGRTYFLYRYHLPILEMDGSGVITAVNTFGNHGLISRQTGGRSVFYSFDPQGSTSQRLDLGASAITTNIFDAYGTSVNTASPSDPFGYGSQFSYAGDVETGLILLGHRYYDATEGRFVTRDPINFVGGIDLYAYVGNNPVQRVDPDGYDGTPPSSPTEPPPGTTIYPSICIEFPQLCQGSARKYRGLFHAATIAG